MAESTITCKEGIELLTETRPCERPSSIRLERYPRADVVRPVAGFIEGRSYERRFASAIFVWVF